MAEGPRDAWFYAAPLGLRLFFLPTQGCAILRADALRMAYPGLSNLAPLGPAAIKSGCKNVHAPGRPGGPYFDMHRSPKFNTFCGMTVMKELKFRGIGSGIFVAL
jgi:hypothetical protein